MCGYRNLQCIVRTQPEITITSKKPLSACETSQISIESSSKFCDNKVLWTLENGSDGTLDDANSETPKYMHGPLDVINKEANLKVTTVPLANDVCPPVSDDIKIIYYLYPNMSPIDNFTGCVPLTTNWTSTENKGIPSANLVYS